jgi:hypothetical protein
MSNIAGNAQSLRPFAWCDRNDPGGVTAQLSSQDSGIENYAKGF